MKPWIALLLALCLLLPCSALCEETAAAETAESAEATETTLRSDRYYFEHRLLPSLLYEGPEELLTFMEQSGAYTLWYNFTQNNGLDLVFAKDDFSQEMIPQEDATRIIRVWLPKPEENLECSRVYLCWNPETSAAAYYTVEYDLFFDVAWYLCGWTADGSHENYGTIGALPAPEDPEYQATLDAETTEILRMFGDVQSAAPSADSGSDGL